MQLNVYSDGGSRNNPGPAGIGFLVYHSSKILYSHSEAIGTASNNVAEYTALRMALTYIKNHLPNVTGITCFADSQLMVKQLNGEYKVKHPDIKQLFFQIKQTEMELGLLPSYVHIPREKNKEADALVNQALDQLEQT